MGAHKWLPSVAIEVGAQAVVTVLRVRVLSGRFHVSGVLKVPVPLFSWQV